MTAITLASGGCMAAGAATSASITNQTATTEVTDPADATAGYKLQSSGQAQKTNLGGTYEDITGEWETSGLPGSLYECRATVTAGSLTTGSTGSWDSLGSDNTWTKDQTVVGNSTCTFTLEIRDAATGTVLDTASITLDATVST